MFHTCTRVHLPSQGEIRKVADVLIKCIGCCQPNSRNIVQCIITLYGHTKVSKVQITEKYSMGKNVQKRLIACFQTLLLQL